MRGTLGHFFADGDYPRDSVPIKFDVLGEYTLFFNVSQHLAFGFRCHQIDNRLVVFFSCDILRPQYFDDTGHFSRCRQIQALDSGVGVLVTAHNLAMQHAGKFNISRVNCRAADLGPDIDPLNAFSYRFQFTHVRILNLQSRP